VSTHAEKDIDEVNDADYSVGFTKEEQREGGIEYNYRREDALKCSNSSDQNVWGTGVDLATYLRERPGVSAFVLEDGVVYHTYSTYARGGNEAKNPRVRSREKA